MPFSGPPGPEVEPGGGSAAPRFRRLVAWGIDTALLCVVAVLLGMMTWGRLHAYVAEDLPQKALTATGGLLFSGGDVQKATTDFGAGVWGTFTSAVYQALGLLVLVELLYQFVAQTWTGRTLGKAVMDIRVRVAAGEARKPGKGRAFRRAVVTTAGGTGLYCLAWIVLLEGLFFAALLVWLLAVFVFVANSLPAMLGGRRRTLADRLAGTAVVRAGTYQRAVAAAVQGAGRAWDGTQAAGRVARDVARENTTRLGQSEQVRRVLESERAQQVQGMGKRLGGRIKGAYHDRRSGRARGETPPLQAADPTPALPPPQPYYDPAQGGFGQQYAPPAPYVPPPAPPAPQEERPGPDEPYRGS
ncbi:RDD family protein [Actinomadura miaoliensis]|uniref:RDD family protein n=1 Tax=Actinomadura miaoliensis TaxID=430685 RepID=UPI0031EB616E